MLRSVLACLLLIAAPGCGDDDDDVVAPGVDSGIDSGVDSGLDAGLDAALDSGVDAGPICGRLAREPIASDLRWPVYATALPGDDRIFVVLRLDSQVIVLDGAGQAGDEPFLDVADETNLADFEAGLLYLAFHPDYANNGYVFVSFTSIDRTLRVARFTVPPETPDAVDPDSEVALLDIPVPANHNVGGVLEFGPDGLLYIGVGDHLHEANGQDMTQLAGKILRIDVDDTGKAPYEVPADNPFVGEKGVAPEIWASGLREPYRIDFDDETGDLYVSDVGEDLFEELEVVPAGDPGGENFGWATMEGPACHTPPDGCDQTGLTEAAYAYSHDEGTAIIGAGVYRGTALPECWQGRYFFGDYPTGWIRTLRWEGDRVLELEQHDELRGDGAFVSFGLDGNGEILIVNEDTLDRIVAADE